MEAVMFRLALALGTIPGALAEAPTTKLDGSSPALAPTVIPGALALRMADSTPRPRLALTDVTGAARLAPIARLELRFTTTPTVMPGKLSVVVGAPIPRRAFAETPGAAMLAPTLRLELRFPPTLTVMPGKLAVYVGTP